MIVRARDIGTPREMATGVREILLWWSRVSGFESLRKSLEWALNTFTYHDAPTRVAMYTGCPILNDDFKYLLNDAFYGKMFHIKFGEVQREPIDDLIKF